VTEVRRITGDERLTRSFPIQAYAFEASPAAAPVSETFRRYLPYAEVNSTYAVVDGDTTLATASGIPMRQNVRGRVLPMAGISGVATHPLARRQGHVRTVLGRLLDEMYESGHAVSALHPFRASFYARFGYVGIPRPRLAELAPAGLAPLHRLELPGEVRLRRVADGYDDWRAFTLGLLERVHGFATFPDERAVALRDEDDRWIATAHVDGAVVGVLTYRIEQHGGTLAGDDLLTTGPLGRTLLLQFLARHVDQVARVTLTVAPGETPELWATDIDVRTSVAVSFPDSPAPMVRVLSVERLAGIATGPGEAVVEVVDDPYVAGVYTLRGGPDGLEVARGGTPAATLTAAGLSALVYGVLDPAEVALRGLGTVPAEAAIALRTVFPPAQPYLFSSF
jgi:predicted acetyltransferase